MLAMKAVVKCALGPGNIELREVPEPPPGPGDVKVEVKAAGVCGSDVHLWHGEDDTVVPLEMGRYLAQAIPNFKARFIPGGGHFSLLPKYVAEILNTLVPSARSSQ